MRTHERNVLMWLLALLLGGCGVSPTAPTPEPDPRAERLAACYAAHLGVSLTVVYESSPRECDGALAWGAYGEVHLSPAILDLGDVDLAWVVLHEALHTAGLSDAEIAERALDIYTDAGCL